MRKFLAVLSACLAWILFASACVATAERATLAAESDTDNLDYSASYAQRVVLTPSALLTAVLTARGDTASVSEAESSYADAYYGNHLTYFSALPRSLLTLRQWGTDALAIAQPYSYTGKNGRTVSWIPVFATCDGVTLPMTLSADGTSYTATFPDKTEQATVSVTYRGSLSLPQGTVNRLLNFAYEDATAALASSRSLADYTAAMAEYRAYQRALADYESAKAAYDGYLTDQALYEEALKEYEANTAAWAVYRQQNEAYQAYLTLKDQYDTAFAQYQAKLAVYEQTDAAYQAYLTNLSAIRTALIPMESLFIDGESTRCLYEALQNAELVVMFEKYQGLLVTNFGVAEQDIRDIRAYSDQLNALLRLYAAEREISEESAFAFYKTNYDEICRLFNYLYDKMSSILTPTIYNLMCGKIELEYTEEGLADYKKWRIKNVLAHIYRICLCLDDTRTVTDEWNFYADTGDPYVYYFSTLLDQAMIIPDPNRSNPSALTWQAPAEPAGEAPVAPLPPTAVTEPVAPPTMDEPIPPPAVTEPLPPPAVTEPALPTDVDHALIQQTEEIRLALAEGTITQRETVSSDLTVLLADTSISKTYTPVSAAPDTGSDAGGDPDKTPDTGEDSDHPSGSEGDSDEPPDTGDGSDGDDPSGDASGDGDETGGDSTPSVVPSLTVYDVNGEVLATLTPDDPLPDLPAVYHDAYYTYTFLGWSTSPVEHLPLPDPIVYDLDVYPLYTAEPRKYTVTFVYGEETLSLAVPFGQIPVFPNETPQKASDGQYDYIFTTWSPSLRPVQEDITYEARFMRIERQYTVTFDVRGTLSVGRYAWQETPTAPTPAPSYVEGTLLYEFSGWDTTPVPVSGDARYTAVYTATPLAALPEGTDGSLSLTSSAVAYTLHGSGNTFALSGLVTLARNEGKRLDVTFSDSGVSLSADRAVLTALAAEGVQTVSLLRDGQGKIGVCFTNAAGVPLSVNGNLRLRLTHSYSSDAGVCVRAYGADGLAADSVAYTVSGGTVELTAAADTLYEITRKFTLTPLASAGGTVSCDTGLCVVGEPISLTVRPNAGYRLNSVTLTNPVTGETLTASTPEALLMPEWDAQVTAEFLPRTYTVEFMYHGGSTVLTYELGATVEVPQIPATYEEDGFFYTFIGWSSPISIVTEDATYTAKYFSVRSEEATGDGSGGAWGRILVRFGIPAAAILAVLTAAIVVPIVLVKQTKKSSKSKQQPKQKTKRKK